MPTPTLATHPRCVQKSCLVKRPTDPASRPLCWNCGKYILTLTNRDVRGVDTMCAACMSAEFTKRGSFTTEKGGDA